MQVQRGPRGSINKQPPLAAQPPRGLLPLALTTALPKCGATLMVGPVDLQLRNQGRGEAAPGSLCFHGSQVSISNCQLFISSSSNQTPESSCWPSLLPCSHICSFCILYLRKWHHPNGKSDLFWTLTKP